MKTEELLLAQIKAYLILAKELKSRYYLSRAQKTLELFYAERTSKSRAA